jgi:hypothetical protein
MASTKSPAGDLLDFTADLDGSPRILPGSPFTAVLESAWGEQEEVCEVLDTHRWCAALFREYGDHPDGGLYAGVLRKKVMAAAMGNFAKQQGTRLVPIHTTYDPRTGFILMGLETDRALAAANAAGGYTDEVLDKLRREGSVLSGASLARLFEQAFMIRFRSFRSKFSLRKNYAESIHEVWKAIHELQPALRKPTYSALKYAFPHLNEACHEKELMTRTGLLLANAFMGFLYSVVADTFPYQHHTEAVVALTGYAKIGPFAVVESAEISPFSKTVADDVLFAVQGLIRPNRAAGRVPDIPVGAPVLAIGKEKARKPVQEETWQRIQETDWSWISGLPMDISADEFMRAVCGRHPAMTDAVGHAFFRVQQGLGKLLDPSQRVYGHILQGRIVPVAMVVDHEVKPRLVFPFLPQS